MTKRLPLTPPVLSILAASVRHACEHWPQWMRLLGYGFDESTRIKS